MFGSRLVVHCFISLYDLVLSQTAPEETSVFPSLIGSIPLPEMPLWLVPVAVVCSCVLVLSCVAIIIAGIVVVRKIKSSKYVQCTLGLFYAIVIFSQ